MLTSILSKATLKKLDISNNKLGDALIFLLSSPGYGNCDLTAAGCKDLANITGTKKSCIQMSLILYELGDGGVELLCEGLKDPKCKLQSVLQQNCGMIANSCGDLATVLSTKPSLQDLALDNNNIRGVDLVLLCKGLIHLNCNIQKLWLWECHFTAVACKDLANVIGIKESLRRMSLTLNELGDAGVEMLCQGLKDPKCKLQFLSLRDSELTTACCDSLAAVISTKQCLRYLGLDLNRLEMRV
uniref:Uncharacterized protein n=1 Tax=Crocodylus porosus TaxID=8502 RepID=A0A7M4ESQ3_CROPO